MAKLREVNSNLWQVLTDKEEETGGFVSKLDLPGGTKYIGTYKQKPVEGRFDSAWDAAEAVESTWRKGQRGKWNRENKKGKKKGKSRK